MNAQVLNKIAPDNNNTMNTEYKELLQQTEWHLKRRKILKRDNNRCRNCGSSKNLQIHHRQYHRYNSTGKMKQPWNYADRLLITLCRPCHNSGHRQYTIPVINL